MSNATRLVLRREWKSDHPAQFNRRQKGDIAEALGKKLAPRVGYRLWLVKKFFPKLYAAWEKRALGETEATSTSAPQTAPVAEATFTRTQVKP